MDKIFIDTDVILDFMLGRQPFVLESALIFSLAERKKIHICTTGLVYSNIYYILRKLAPHKKVIEQLTKLTKLTEVIDLSKKVVISALESEFNDFEDALQYFAAWTVNCKMIITRNTKDYKYSELSVLTPGQFLNRSTYN